MASVYILYSSSADSFYIGSCKDLQERLVQHKEKTFDGFTSNNDDWELFFSINDLEYAQVRDIEIHIKKMKSRKYLQNLAQFPEMKEKLILRYNN